MNVTFTNAAAVAHATAAAAPALLLPTQLLGDPVLRIRERSQPFPAGRLPRLEASTAQSEPRFTGDRQREYAQSR